MKLKTLSALVLAASTLAMTSTAMAWESEDGNVSTSANVGLFSDYMFRGISFTDDKPAIQGGFDVAHSSGLYAGTWASNLSIDDETNIEIDVYAGFASEFGESGVGYDVGVLRYIYPGDSASSYNEYYAGLSYSYFSLGVAYTDDFVGSDEDEIYYSLGFDYALPYDLGLYAGIGFTDSDRNDFDPTLEDSYIDYTVSLTKPFAGFDWTLAYVGVNDDGDDFAAAESNAEDRFVFSVGASF